MRKNSTHLLMTLMIAVGCGWTATFGAQDARRDGASDARVMPRGSVPQEDGEMGYVAPQAVDVIAPDAPVHSDTTGTAAHELLELAGSASGGFAAVWRDGRDGNMGLYFARVGPDGAPREPDRPFYVTARSSRQLDPTIALNANGAGAFGWRDGAISDGSFYGRILHADGQIESAQNVLGNGAGELTIDKSRAREPVRTSVAVASDGTALFTWIDRSTVYFQRLRPGETSPEKPTVLSVAERGAEGKAWIACGADNGWVCAWSAHGKVEFLARGSRGADVRGQIGDGAPLGIHFDPSTSSWWVLAEVGARRVLRHLNEKFAVEGADVVPIAAPLTTLDFACAPWGIVALVGRGGTRGSGSASQAIFLGPHGEPNVRAPYDLRADDGELGSVRVAAGGNQVLIAWNESSEGEHTIRARTISAKGEVGAVHTLNRDTASANQTQGEISSNGGPKVVCAWLDGRAGTPRAYARLLNAGGGYASDEIVLPAPFEGAKPSANAAQGPNVSMDSAGRFIALWSEESGRAWQLRAQIFDASAKAISAPCALDDSLGASATSVATPGGNGFVVAWSRGGDAIVVRAVSERGEPLAQPLVVSSGSQVADPFVTALDRRRPNDAQRYLVTWDITLPKLGKRLRARFLDADLKPLGTEFNFDTMQGGSDWDAHTTPAANGGFAMSWTSGEDRMRDIFARVFDADGKPIARPFAICFHNNEQDFSSIARLKDGSFAVVWEDDISYYDFVYVRRLAADGNGIGPMLTLCERPDEFEREHVGPRVTACGAGLAAIWGDTRRSRGFDTYWKVLGPKFDVNVPRQSSGKH